MEKRKGKKKGRKEKRKKGRNERRHRQPEGLKRLSPGRSEAAIAAKRRPGRRVIEE